MTVAGIIIIAAAIGVAAFAVALASRGTARPFCGYSFLVGLVALAVVFGLPLLDGDGAHKDRDPYTEASVVRVVDGDTVLVMQEGGQANTECYVRLIGIDAPESVHPDKDRNTAGGAEAGRYMEGILSEGQTVWLEADISDVDRYGRLLRYVWREKPSDRTDIEEVKSKMLNAVLVDSGYAEPIRYEPDTKYAEALEAIHAERLSGGGE